MPNISVMVPELNMPSEKLRDEFSQECAELAIHILRAKPDKVHIAFIKSILGFGHPVRIDIQYRLETFRTPEVMERFLNELNLSVEKTLKLTARIRCFGYEPFTIYALH